jgi:hypothetical protein
VGRPPPSEVRNAEKVQDASPLPNGLGGVRSVNDLGASNEEAVAVRGSYTRTADNHLQRSVEPKKDQSQ